MTRKLYTPTLLLALSLVLSTLFPAGADVPIDPQMERQFMNQQLNKELEGLSPAQQIEKVKSMLAQIPLEKAALDEQIKNPPDNGMPIYMIGKQKAGLDRKATFLQEWLTQHEGSSTKESSNHEEHIPAASPLSPGLAIGGFFLIGGMLLGARRLLSPKAAE